LEGRGLEDGWVIGADGCVGAVVVEGWLVSRLAGWGVSAVGETGWDGLGLFVEAADVVSSGG
jgi:hypothetical protein